MGTDADRDREDRRTFSRLKIAFQGRASNWPVHHLKTFQQISVLGSMRYSTYCTDRDGSNFWKHETKARAQRLVDTVSRLTRNQSSEIQWRLDIEKIVYKRFELEINCPSCKNRLWRSEIEAEPEVSDEITKSLQKRRVDRAPCSCTAEVKLRNQGSIDLNRNFDYRADEFIIHGGEAHYDLRPRKPDRVYGLQQTKFFAQALQVITAAIQDRVTEEGELEENFKAFQFTPFEERARPLIFPFLISEAKTERGDSFDACERQTAFPIWTLLRMQEVLQARSNQRLTEQGGSLVWFFANRGEEWRLYGCFTDIEEYGTDQYTSYNILDLWTGRLDSPDGALQILLLVDYIFDWARDLYRHGIARLLKTLCKKASGKELNDTISISLDTDFFSINQEVVALQEQMELDPPSHQGVATWQHQMELDPPAPQFAEIVENPDLCEVKFKQWQNTDTVAGAFRDPTIIETSFECVQFTNDVFHTLLAPFITSGIPEERLQQFTLAIKEAVAGHAVMISDDVLSYLEEQWTGNRRLHDGGAPGSRVRHDIIVYYVHLSDRWQPRRVIACIVFNQDVIKTMRRKAGRKIAVGTKDDTLPEVTTHDVATLVQHLRGQSMRDNLVAAIETRSVFLDKQASGTPGFESKPSSPFEIPALFQVLQIISSQDPRGSIEPLTRFSSVIEFQKMNSTDATSTFIEPYETYPSFGSPHCRIKYLLVYSNTIREVTELGGPEWCLFCLDTNGNVPDIKDQFNHLTNIWERDGFYVTYYFLSRVKKISHWRRYTDWDYATEALLQWKAMLEDIYTIKYLANLAETEPLALSSSMKRSMAGRSGRKDFGRFGSRMKSWDMFRVKREFVEGGSE
ncbi:Uncharacterized protein BP5553_05624 [Venustampulla echinocandica]|uniref:DUF7924 domain-containing protein n=1 Tax=Venustampulla echinocandica TaxID=2656787 RepID=A0A370TRQ2_9HELO|nr:Uncharacterized protein BP5553_05624 [Venustampulla echinocandica]RDL38191.1 Uncharacterized protein BP5553_05624 [Venustampulla echinocandica]